MKSDLSFLPERVRDDPTFQTAWCLAVMQIYGAAQGDYQGRGGTHQRKAIQAAADRTKDAAWLLRDEIDRGAFAGFFPVEAVGYSPDAVQTVRHFLNVLGQHLHVAAPETIERIPDKAEKQAMRLAGYFAGRLCAQFGLGKPKKYVPDDPDALYRACDAVRLMRCLLIDGRADHEPSRDTLKRGMVFAIEGFSEFLGGKTLSSE